MSTELDYPHTLMTTEVVARVMPQKKLLLIEPERGWQPINVRELWHFRELIGFLIWRDVKVRYKQTALGAAWAILQPAMLMVVFVVFLGKVANVAVDGPRPLFTYLGVLPWSFFATAITNAGNSVVGSERLITKIYFPRLAIPIAAVGAAVVDFIIALTLLFGMMLYYGVTPSMHLLLLPVIFGVIALIALGIGTLLAGLNVLYRDFRYVIPFMVQIWMFATPTIYMKPTGAQGGLWALLWLNPITGLIAAFRDVCLGRAPNLAQLGAATVAGVIVFVLGCACFRRLETQFADII